MIVGVNRFAEDEEEHVELHRLDPAIERRQLERTARVRAERNADEAERALARGEARRRRPTRTCCRRCARRSAPASRSARSRTSSARSGARSTPRARSFTTRKQEIHLPAAHEGAALADDAPVIEGRIAHAEDIHCGAADVWCRQRRRRLPPARPQTGPSSSQAAVRDPVARTAWSRSRSSRSATRSTAIGWSGSRTGSAPTRAAKGTFTLLANHEMAQTIWAPSRDHGADRRVRLALGRSTRTTSPSRRVAITSSASQPGTRPRAAYNAPAKGVVARPALLGRPRAAQSAFYDKKHQDRLQRRRSSSSGEEVGNEGRAFAHAEGGISWEAALARQVSSCENAGRAIRRPAARRSSSAPTTRARPARCTSTWARRRRRGNPAERAGLTGGTLYGIKVPGSATEPGQHRHSERHRLHSGESRRRQEHDRRSDRDGERRRSGDRVAASRRTRRGIRSIRTTSTSRSRRASRRRASSTGSGSPIRPTRPPAAGSTSCWTGPRPAGRPSGLHMLDNITVDTRGNVMLEEDPGQPAVSRPRSGSTTSSATR